MSMRHAQWSSLLQMTAAVDEAEQILIQWEPINKSYIHVQLEQESREAMDGSQQE